MSEQGKIPVKAILQCIGEHADQEMYYNEVAEHGRDPDLVQALEEIVRKVIYNTLDTQAPALLRQRDELVKMLEEALQFIQATYDLDTGPHGKAEDTTYTEELIEKFQDVLTEHKKEPT